MTQKGAPRFDVDMLRDRAGDKAFARGADYFRSEQVQILIIEAGRVLAQVAGSEDYRTELRGQGKSIDGHCSCPAFAEFGFCKHMVALGLAANAAGDGAGALTQIRDHLKSKSVDFLAAMIVDVAERDPKLFRKLELAATTAQLDDATLEARLRKAIDRATVAGDYIDYVSVRDWAEGVEETLEAIEQLLSNERAGVALKLAGRAIDRIERALRSVDDSDGDGGALLAYAEEIHLAAARESRPEPVQFARGLFARDMNSDYGFAAGSVATYEEVLGERGLAEYRRLAEAVWQKSSARSRKSEEFSSDLDRLARIMDFFAERDGDVEARVALRARNLSSSHRYLELAQFCLEHHRKQEALRYAEEGLWMFEDEQQDERLVLFTADLLEKVNRTDAAAAHLWRAFEKAPSLQLYARLRKIGGEGACRRALHSLEQRCTRQSGGGWNGLADLIVEIHLSEKAFDEAWASLRRFGGSIHLKDKLAKATEKTHPAEVIQVYEAHVERLATSGGYAEAARLIARMSELRDKVEHGAYLAAVKERHGRKRNFMKLLG